MNNRSSNGRHQPQPVPAPKQSLIWLGVADQFVHLANSSWALRRVTWKQETKFVIQFHGRSTHKDRDTLRRRVAIAKRAGHHREAAASGDSAAGQLRFQGPQRTNSVRRQQRKFVAAAHRSHPIHSHPKAIPHGKAIVLPSVVLPATAPPSGTLWQLGLGGCCWLLACGAALGPSSGSGRDFRGPNGSGESEAKIPAQWTDRDINWKVELPGAGHSSPVVWGTSIFLTGAKADGNTFMVLALDSMDGHVQWKKEYPASSYHIHTQNSFATGTPAVDAERVYVAWATPQAYTLVALSHSGEEVWRHSLGSFTSQHGFGSSPIVCGDLVVIDDEQDGANPNEMSSSKKKGAPGAGPTADGDDDGKSFLLAVDAATGTERWKAPRKSTVVTYSTPCLRQTAAGKQELVCDSRSHGFSGIDLATGHLNWELPIFDRRAVGSPILVGKLVLGACGVGSGNKHALRGSTRRDRRRISHNKSIKLIRPRPHMCRTPVAKGNLVFMWSDRGFATCITRPDWQNACGHGESGGDYSGSPVRGRSPVRGLGRWRSRCAGGGRQIRATGAQSTQRNMPQHAGDRGGTNVRSDGESSAVDWRAEVVS